MPKTDASQLFKKERTLLFLVAAFRADALVVEGDAAERAAVEPVVFGRELGGCGIVAAAEGQLHYVQLVLEQIVDNLYHPLHGHRLFGDHQTAVRVGGRQLRLEGRALHPVLRVSVPYPLALIDLKHCRKQRVVLAEDQRVVEVLEDLPGGLPDFVAREYHIDSFVDAVFHLDGKRACVAVKILSFSLEVQETVRILQIESCNASHNDDF